MSAAWPVRDDVDEEEAIAASSPEPRRLVAVTAPGTDAGMDPVRYQEHAAIELQRPPPATAPTIDGLHHQLGAAVRRGAGERANLDAADVNAAVEGAVWLVASGRGTEATPAAIRAGHALTAMAEVAERELQLPAGARRLVDWSRFGALLPVLAGSPGAGASVVAVVLADALQQAGRCVLVVDAADPARSGLALAAAVDGPWAGHPHKALTVRYSWRNRAVLARLESRLPMVTAGMVPPPPAWLPALNPLHATVVDVGHDGWRAAADPLVGAGGWLRYGTPAPRPVLVVRATRPSLRHAEQVLARLDPWIAAGIAVPPCQLVVNGAKRWPAGVAGAAGHRVASLLADALFVPHHHDIEVGGVTDAPLPHRVIDAVAPLLRQWGLLPPDSHIAHARKGRRS